MKVLNLVLLSLLAVFFTACSSKPKCDDKQVVSLVKDILFENGAVGDALMNDIMRGNVANMSIQKYTKGLESVAQVAQNTGVLLNRYGDFYLFHTSKLDKDGLQSFNLLKEAADRFYKTKPYTIMTTDDNDKKITYCKMQFANDSNPFEYTAQLTDDGKIYVEIKK